MVRRLPPVAGEWITRGEPISFVFEGENYTGFEGDTVSSALAANGVRMLGRSFKYHRPRGILSLANHDINALLQDGPRLNLRGDVEPLRSGMQLAAVNTFGGLKRDYAGILALLSRFLPVGFYYKAFHTPRALFPFWERAFRRISGLGGLDLGAGRIRSAKRYDFCDVLVVGAGPAGLSAAAAAGAAGARVVLVDENARAGGSLGYQRGARTATLDTLDELEARISALANVSLRPGTLAAAYYPDHGVPMVEGSRVTKMRARCVVLATGVLEQPAVFRNNDLPGVMLASAAQRLIYRYAVMPMHRVLVLTANAEGYAAARDLQQHGVEIAAIVDLRAGGDPLAATELAHRGVPVVPGACVNEARGSSGVTSAIVCPLDATAQ